MPVQIKRIYEPSEKSDGMRILVDRLWPRGVSKERADLDDWVKVVSPSTELRKWFGHKAKNFDEFSKRYKKELDANSEAQDAIKKIIEQSKKGMVTLLFADRDPELSNAILLKDYIENKIHGVKV